jgi:hypothetical protein
MTSIPDNEIRTLPHDELELVNGGGSLPVPPIHGGPIHTPVIGTSLGTPITEPLIPMPIPGPLL